MSPSSRTGTFRWTQAGRGIVRAIALLVCGVAPTGTWGDSGAEETDGQEVTCLPSPTKGGALLTHADARRIFLRAEGAYRRAIELLAAGAVDAKVLPVRDRAFAGFTRVQNEGGPAWREAAMRRLLDLEERLRSRRLQNGAALCPCDVAKLGADACSIYFQAIRKVLFEQGGGCKSGIRKLLASPAELQRLPCPPQPPPPPPDPFKDNGAVPDPESDAIERVQFQFGGTNEDVEVEPALVAHARACVLAAPSLPVYARVDGVAKDGTFLLMELEVFEPLMFLARHPEAPERFARAVQGRLAARAGG